MQTISVESFNYSLQIPTSDKAFFTALVKKMGWKAKRNKTAESIPSATFAALEEARSGKDAGVVNTSSLEDFVKSMD